MYKTRAWKPNSKKQHYELVSQLLGPHPISNKQVLAKNAVELNVSIECIKEDLLDKTYDTNADLWTGYERDVCQNKGRTVQCKLGF